MDEKFRLVIRESYQTPVGADYLAPEAAVYDCLREALRAAHAGAEGKFVPFIAHRHMVFDPHAIAVLHAEFVAPTPGA